MQRHVQTLLANQTATRDLLADQEQNLAVFEQVTLQHLRLTLSNHFSVTSKLHTSHISAGKLISASLETMNPAKDWMLFRERHRDVILDQTKPLVREQEVEYEGMTDPGCEVVREGVLQKRIMGVFGGKGWKSGYFVLTVSGFLHGFSGVESVAGGEPGEMSVWLPECTVGVKGALDTKEPGEFLVQERSGGLFGGGGKHRLKAEGGDESDFWYELVSATAQPLVVRPELLATLKEEEPSSSPRPSSSEPAPGTPTAAAVASSPTVSTPVAATPVASTPVSTAPAILDAPVPVTPVKEQQQPQFEHPASVYGDLVVGGQVEEEVEVPKELEGLRDSLFGRKEASVGWEGGSQVTLGGGNAWADGEDSPWV
ncbi:hypothetical protein HDU97_005295 [Phlyctochytrium planicorne]|nr:hypothetical protein HDU97_005295 [Phlyctochytrium planicorne]